ncbi:hypothetical protein [Pelagibacterium sediminicola]|uniref:hypothetical protein n=1 Tax=Pelagibacterium sediminicola TaxID=2248761 RepID=UPI000E30C49F|nr:hypothetical protein [Pelagibacterium sediminicola]
MTEICYIKPVNVSYLLHLPRLIGICGHPGAGKSDVQNALEKHFHYTPTDDGQPLRAIAIDQFGLSHDDVYTQAGKHCHSTIDGRYIQHRDVLGRIGNALETQLGENLLAWLETKNLDPSNRYSFGSVRRQQGVVYRALGGVILGIRRPSVEPSRYEFDRFDESLVDV